MKPFKTAIFLIAFFLLYSVATAQENDRYNYEARPVQIKKTEHKGWGIVPIPVVAYMPETSLLGSVALTAYNEDNSGDKKDNILLAFYYTLKNQIGGNFLGTKYLNDESMKISLEINAVKFPTSFYGTGNSVKDNDEENFEGRSIDITPAFMLEIYKNLYIGPLVNFYNDNLKYIGKSSPHRAHFLKGAPPQRVDFLCPSPSFIQKIP